MMEFQTVGNDRGFKPQEMTGVSNCRKLRGFQIVGNNGGFKPPEIARLKLSFQGLAKTGSNLLTMLALSEKMKWQILHLMGVKITGNTKNNPAKNNFSCSVISSIYCLINLI